MQDVFHSLPALSADRQLVAGLQWAEATIGGRLSEVVEVERPAGKQVARPQFVLRLQMPDASERRVLMRGYREPGLLDDRPGTFRRLDLEAGFIRALQDTRVKVPRYYGYNAQLGWILMAFVEGSEMLTDVADREVQFQLFRQLIDNLVELHHLDPDELDLPATLPRPRDAEERTFGTYFMEGLRRFRTARREDARAPADPIIELGLWWTLTHAVPNQDLRLVTGDAGPLQFRFVGAELKTLFDFEMACISNPLQDLGMLRFRCLCYPVPRLEEHLRYYLERMGGTLSAKAMDFWTMTQCLAGPLRWAANPVDPNRADMIPAISTLIRRRLMVELMLAAYGWSREPPELDAGLIETFAEELHPQLLEHLARVRERAVGSAARHYDLERTAALVEALHTNGRVGALFERQSREELAVLLGHRVASTKSGLAELAGQIAADPGRDLQPRLLFLYRWCVRTETIQAPLMRLSGYRVPNHPLALVH